jgi:CBS-domain-containing membrane protein
MQEGFFGEARGLTVADVMDRQPVAMPADASVQRALDEYFWRYRWPWFPVVDSTGVFVGLIEQNAVDRVDERERGARHAGELVAPDSQRDCAVREDTPLTALLANDQIRDFGSLMAVDDRGALSGVVTLQQVQRALREAIARATQQDAPPPGQPT